MKDNAQLLPVTERLMEPKLSVLGRNGAKLDLPSISSIHLPSNRRRYRRELEILGWETRRIRLGR